MTLPTTTNEVAQFNDAKDEVYFLKQVFSFTRKQRLTKELWSGRDHDDIGKGLSIWLCKMKADGSSKTEIKELWKNPAFAIDTQGQSTWLDVNRKTRKIALSIAYAGGDITGLWTVGLDGCDLKRIITPDRNTNYLQAINHASWTPDGQWLFFEEELRGMNPNRFNIAKCSAMGSNFARLFEATEIIQYKEPSVAPDGKQLAFSRYPDGYPGGRFIWIASLDGKNATPLGGKDSPRNWGSDPAWSPDGKLIRAIGAGVIDVPSGKVVNWHSPKRNGKDHACGWIHWGKTGILGYNLTGILFTDNEIKTQLVLGISQLVERKEGSSTCAW